MPRKKRVTTGKGRGVRTGVDPIDGILTAALSRATSPALRDWLTALASDKADRTSSAERPAGTIERQG
jgi:hypothetical protein